MPWIDLALHVLFSAIGTLLISLTGFLLALLFWRILKVRADREHSIVLENKGNCHSIYYLDVKSPEPSLRFTLLFNKLPLAAVYLPDEPDEPIEFQPQPVENLPRKTGQPEGKPASTPSLSSGTDSVAKAGQSVASVAGQSSSFLEQIGNLLPGSLGSKFKQQASAGRAVQKSSLSTSRAPQTFQRQVSALQPKGIGKQQQKVAAKQSVVVNDDGIAASPTRQSKVSVSAKESYFVQTPAIEPGQSINLSLRVGTQRRYYPKGSFPYTIEALPVNSDFPHAAATPIIKNGIVHFNPVGRWRYFLPAFSTVTFILMAVTALIFLYRFIWL